MNTWLNELPEHLRGAGHRYEPTEEMAWAKVDAMEVLTHLRALGKRVVGLEIWDMSAGVPTLTDIFSWTFDRREGESLDDFSRRSVESALAIVSEFEWPSQDLTGPRGIPMFCITLDED